MGEGDPLPAREAAELAAQVLHRVRPHGLPLPAEHGEPHRPVERRQVPGLKPAGLAFLETQPHHAAALFHLVVHRHAIAVQVHRGGQRVEHPPLGFGNRGVGIERQAGAEELVPRADALELRRESRRHGLGGRLREPSPGAAPVQAEALQRAADSRLVGVGRPAAEQRFDQRRPRRSGELRRERVRERLDVAIEHEAAVRDRAHQHQPLAPPLSLEGDAGLAVLDVAADGALGELGALDARPWHAEAVRKVAQRAGDRPPASGYRPAAHPRFAAVRRLLVDDEVERHDLRNEIGERGQRLLARVRQPRRERQLELAVHGGRAERDVLDRLHEHAAALRPAIDRLVEEMPREPVHLAQVAVVVHGLGVHVVRREVIASGDDQPPEIPFFAGHAVQRLDVRGHGHHRDELRIRVVQQFAPGPLHRHRFDFASVAREPPLLDETTLAEKPNRLAIGPAVERHGQLQIGRVDSQGRARDRHPFGVSRELELRARRPELVEGEVAVAQDEDLAALHAPVHAPRHLQQLVRPQVQPGQHVAPALHHVGVPGVVDHDRVEAADVQRRLAGGRHGEEKGSLHEPVQERTDHADRLAAVVERRGQRLPAVAQLARDQLHLGARGDEYRDAAPLPHRPPDEAVVQELERLLRQDPHGGRLRGIEGPGLEHFDRSEVARVEGGVDGRRQPDEAAARPLAQREAQFQLRRRLVDLVHHERVARGDEVVLEPAARDARRHDHDVPGGRLGRRLALAIHDADLERRREDRLGDGSDRERLSGPRPRHDPEPAPGGREPPDVRSVLPREQGVDVEAHRELDRLAGRARGGDHEDAPRGGLGGEKGGRIGGKKVVAGNSHGRNIDGRPTAATLK